MKYTTEEYKTLDNGGRPFLVFIKHIEDDTGVRITSQVKIYRIRHDEIEDSRYIEYEEYWGEDTHVITINDPKEIFIGESPKISMTKFSGGYGDEFDGNSILINTKGNDYIYIGDEIYSFTSKHKIVKFSSPVGNSLVSYPWAKDLKNNFYMLVEHTVIKKTLYTTEDPYWIYYHHREEYVKSIEDMNVTMIAERDYTF